MDTEDSPGGRRQQKVLDGMLVELTGDCRGHGTLRGRCCRPGLDERPPYPRCEPEREGCRCGTHTQLSRRKYSVRWWKPPPSVPAVLWSI